MDPSDSHTGHCEYAPETASQPHATPHATPAMREAHSKDQQKQGSRPKAEAAEFTPCQLPQLLCNTGLLMLDIRRFSPPPPIAKLIIDNAILFPMGVLVKGVPTQISPQIGGLREELLQPAKMEMQATQEQAASQRVDDV